MHAKQEILQKKETFPLISPYTLPPTFQCRIIVSAPNGTANGANPEPNTGVIFVCSLEQNGTCLPLNGDNNGDDRRLYDTDAGKFIMYL